MEDKLINKILNFSDENISTAQELVITKEQAREFIRELNRDYVPRVIIKSKLADLVKQIKECKCRKGDTEEYKKDMRNEQIKLLRSKAILEELL